MSSPSLITVAGPCGGGKTTWISQHFDDQTRPLFYLYPGLGNISVNLAEIGYRFPWVQVIPDQEIQSVLSNLPNGAVVYVELGFHMDLGSVSFGSLPCHRVAVVPPSLQDSESEWHTWADEVVPGCDTAELDVAKHPELWCTPLTGRVFDPPSLDVFLIELTEGAYGQVHRVKGIFELPDGNAFYVDFVEGLSGIEYTDLTLPRWLDGRPERFSGIEVVGCNLDQEVIAQTLLDCCLSDEAIAQYHAQYKAYLEEKAESESGHATDDEPGSESDRDTNSETNTEKEIFA
ncbi:MAG: cobalamin biosynthesis protein CobW [Merismopedia sp. SIO2A8]|nr:cobalamin biosynthesis protein CobW [Merismopedia sp. SIO2A8]